jgi:hypothetical protein
MRLRDLIAESEPSISSVDDIAKWLSDYDIHKTVIHEDLTVSVNSFVDLSDYSIAYLPIQFRVVTGHFALPPSIKSLKGSPSKVLGSYSVNNNHNLTSLVGAPVQVDGDVNIENASNLTSLLGSPNNVGGNFNISFCSKIMTLEGCPTIVGDKFDASNCDNLISLKGICNTIYGPLDVSYCPRLTSFQWCPSWVGRFNGVGCINLNTLEYLPKTISSSFNIRLCPKILDPLEASRLFFIDKLKAVIISDDPSDDNANTKAQRIINRHLAKPMSNKRWIECQSELIDAGLEQFAE